MLSKPAILNLLSKELDNLDISIFEKRKILQKTIYILSKMGLDLGYHYNWYLYGPYSPSLTEDAYELANNKNYYDSEIEGYVFKDKIRQIIKKFNILFNERKNDEDWLELVASLLFLEDNYKKKGEELKQLLLRKKSKFRDREQLVDEAIEFIKKIKKYLSTSRCT